MTKFETFAALHVPGDPLVLYNVWDPGSAKAAAAGGAAAIAASNDPLIVLARRIEPRSRALIERYKPIDGAITAAQASRPNSSPMTEKI